MSDDVLLKPAFFSPYLDGPDATKLQPSAWNAARLFSGGVDGQVVTRSAASPTGAVWSPVPAPDLSGLVVTTRTVNGHALSADVTVSKADVGLAAVENTALSTWAGSLTLPAFGMATAPIAGVRLALGNGAWALVPPQAPNAPVVVNGAAGSIPAGVYKYRCSWTGATIGIAASPEESTLGTVSSDWTADGAHNATVAQPTGPAPSNATGWKVYRSAVNAIVDPTVSYIHYYALSGVLPLATATYTDSTADTTANPDAGELSATLGTRIYSDGLVAGVLGTYNAAWGLYSLQKNTVGQFNAAFGRGALGENTTGKFNTALGGDTLKLNVTGSYNVAIGVDALQLNTAGNENTAVGTAACNLTTAGGNTAVGRGALGTNVSGAECVAVGYTALSLSTQNSNAALGAYAGRTITSGVGNTFVGFSAGFHASQKLNPANTMALGNGAYTAADNTVVVGNASVTDVYLGSVTGAAKLHTAGITAGTAAAAPNGVEGYFVSTSTSDPRGLMSAQFTTDAIGARIHLRKGRGAEAAPTTIVTGDVLGRIRFSGYDGANYLQMASIDCGSMGTIAATRVPTYLAFSVATDATPSVLTEMLRVTAAGVTIQGLTVGLGKSAVAGNTALGVLALATVTTGASNTAIGYQALNAVGAGGSNTAIGVNAMVSATNSDLNTAVGGYALYSLGLSGYVSGNVGLGYAAGKYEVGSDAFYVNNQDRTNTAGDKAKSLLYGTFNATAASQTLKINAKVTIGVAIPAFVASDKYLVVDASGNVHVSALGPAS